MSATNRGAERVADDFYATPEWCTRAIVRALPEAFAGVVLDPCAGDGAILSAIRNTLCGAPSNLFGIELDRQRAELCGVVADTICGDFLTAPLTTFAGRGTICTNPPYSLAFEFVQRACELRPECVIFLLRLNWLGSGRRSGRDKWLRAHMPDVYVLPRRPSFTGKGTDATEYAWVVWRPEHAHKSAGSIQVLDL